jgi:hypothetical protein
MKMKKSYPASSLVLALLVGAMAVGSVPISAVSAAPSDACTPQTNPFSVTSANWGTAGSPESVYPGSQDVPLTVTMLFSGPCTSPQATFELSLATQTNPVPFTGQNGETQPKDIGLNIDPNTIVTETFYLNVDQGATTGVTYYIPLDIQYANNTVSNVVTQVTSAPISLFGPVQLSFNAGTTHLLAGAVNNVTITTSNSGSSASGPVSITATAPTGVTVFSQLATTPAIEPGTSVSEVLQLYVPSSLNGTAFVVTLNAKYVDAYSNAQTASQTLGFTASTTSAQSSSSFVIEGASWGTAASATMPAQGTQGEALVVSVQYLGTASVASIKGTLTLPAGFTDLNGQPTATVYAATATPNQVVTLTFYLDIGSGVKPGSYSFPLDLSWLTSTSASESEGGIVSPPPIASQATTASFPLSVTQQNSTITAGSQTSAAFVVANDGSATISSPTFSLSVNSPLVIASVGSPIPVPEVEPGSTATFVAQITSGPSATPGIYSGTLTVVFSDSSGASHTQTFPLSFTLEGTVILILQDTAVSQTATGFTVTGSILNEGSVAVYYASITGLLGVNSATPVYMGEIDPDTPLPFSVTIPFTAPVTVTTTTTSSTSANGSSSATSTSTTTSTVTGSRSFTGFAGGFNRTTLGNGTLTGFPGLLTGTLGIAGSTGAGAATIALTLSYKDTFGNVKTQGFSVATTIKTASQLGDGSATTFSTGKTSGNDDLTDIAYGVVALVAATFVVGALMLRRYRKNKFASMPQESRGEQSVI